MKDIVRDLEKASYHLIKLAGVFDTVGNKCREAVNNSSGDQELPNIHHVGVDIDCDGVDIILEVQIGDSEYVGGEIFYTRDRIEVLRAKVERAVQEAIVEVNNI